MFGWKKINRTINKLRKTRRIMGGYLVNSVKKNNKNDKNKKNRTRKSHMSSLLPAIMNH